MSRGLSSIEDAQQLLTAIRKNCSHFDNSSLVWDLLQWLESQSKVPEDLGTNYDELDLIIQRAHLSQARLYLRSARLSIGVEVPITVQAIRGHLEKAGLLPQAIDTSEEELRKLSTQVG